MKLNGQRNTKISLRSENTAPLRFDVGPIKFVCHLPDEAIIPVFMMNLNGGTYVRKFPIYLEIQEAQNFIDFQILRCDEHFTNFIVGCNINDRIGIKLSHGNKIGRIYRLFPTGTLQRLNEETSQNE